MYRLVGVRGQGARDSGDHVPDGRLHHVVVREDVHELSLGGPQRVCQALDAALEVGRPGRAPQRREEGLRVAIAQRQHRDGGDGVRGVVAAKVEGGVGVKVPRVGAKGVPRAEAQELRRPALHPGRRPPGPLGVDCALAVAVVLRVGEDKNGRGPARLGIHGLEPAEAGPVPRQYHLAGHVHARLGEHVEVLGPSIVGVDGLAADVAGRRVAVKSEVAPGRVRGGVLRQHILRQRRGEKQRAACRVRQLHLRKNHQHICRGVARGKGVA